MSNLSTYNFPTTYNGVIEIFADNILTVDKMLDYPDVSLDWYIPSLDAFDFINFIRLVLGEEPENTSPKAHYFLIDCIFQNDNVRPYFEARSIDFDELKGRTIILCTREFGKSVLIIYLLLYMAVKGKIPNFGKVNYGLYVSDSMRNGVKTTMETIGKVYQESIYLQSQFEEVRLVQDEVNFVRKPTTKKEKDLYEEYVNVMGKSPKNVPGRMKRTFSVSGLGAATGGRGSRDGLARPQFAIFDDMVPSESDASSDIVLNNIESTIEADVLKALSGNGNFAIAIGTPYNKKDPIYRRIEQKSWLPVVFPRAAKVPIDGMKESEFQSVWSDRHTFKQCRLDYVRAKKSSDSGDPAPMRRLLQENYLRIANEEDRLIPDSLIQFTNTNNIIENAELYNWYLTTDYTSTGSKGSDFSGAALWAVASSGDVFLVDLVLQKLELEEQYRKTFDMVEMVSGSVRWVDVGVEIDGQQNIHIYSLKKMMSERNTYFSFARQKGAKLGSEGIRSRLQGGNKHWRFREMLPMFQNRKIWFSNQIKDTADMRELMEEIKYTSYASIGSKHDDGIDLISQLNMIDITYPSKEFRPKSVETKKKNTALNNFIWGNSAEINKSTIYDSYN